MKIPVSGTYHTAVPQYAATLTGDGTIGELVWRYIIWFYDQLDFILVPSKATGRELEQKGISPSKIRLFPRGVDLERFNPSKRKMKVMRDRFGAVNGVKVLYVGRISKEKDLGLLVQAFRELSENRKDVELVFVGDGPYLEELRRSAADLPCIFTGYLEGEELTAAYASCDLFAFPSGTDTFGNVVLEAQASGLPVIVTDSGGPQENVIDGKTGLIVRAGEVGGLREALDALLGDSLRRKEMGRAARKYVETRSYEQAFEDSWDLYLGQPTQPETAREKIERPHHSRAA